VAVCAGAPTGGISGALASGRGSLDQFKRGFFDAESVIKAMDKGTAKALSKHGAFVRRRAQTSIRYRLQPSEPGQPPSAHRTMTRNKTNKKTGVTKKQQVSPLREFLFFAYEFNVRTVVIGPAATNQRNALGMEGKTVPEVLEYGGTVGILEYLARSYVGADGVKVPERWRRIDLRSPRRASGRPQRQRTASYPARPYMNPAHQAELKTLPALLTNII